MLLNHDDEMKSVAVVFESANELLDKAEELNLDGSRVRQSVYFDECRGLNGWGDVRDRLNLPYEKGSRMMEEAAETIRKAVLEPPFSIRRQRRWSENDGELDVDRAIRGVPELFRESFRTKRHRVQNVAIMTNYGANCNVSEETLMWRSAAVTVAVDLLEEAGYSCEVWGYWVTENVYNGKHPHMFVAQQLKDCGSPMDVDTVSKALSPWMFRTATFSICSIDGRPNYGLGHSCDYNRERYFSRHCNVDSGMERIFMPYAFGKTASIQAVKNIIESIQQPA